MLERLIFHVHPIEHARGLVLVLFTPTKKKTYDESVPRVVKRATQKALEEEMDSFLLNTDHAIGILAGEKYQLMLTRFKKHEALCRHHGVQPHDVVLTLECYVTKKKRRKHARGHRRIKGTATNGSEINVSIAGRTGIEVDRFQQAIDEVDRGNMAVLDQLDGIENHRTGAW